MRWFSHLFAVAAVAALIAPADATPYPVQMNFFGTTQGGAPPWVAPWSKLTGYFRFDAGTPATAPGVWNLPTAVFHVQYDGVTIDTVGATAHTWNDGEAITFNLDVPYADIPDPDAIFTLTMTFEAYHDNAYSAWHLPTTEVAVDHWLMLWRNDEMLVGTEYFDIRYVPEPATAAVLLAGLLAIARKRRRDRRAAAPAVR